MDFLKKQNKIEFFIPNSVAAENYPILTVKDYKLDWVKRARSSLEKARIDGRFNNPGFTHLARCPGIFELLKYGYVVQTHRDILISPNETGFEWAVAGLGEGSCNVSDGYNGGVGQAIDILSRVEWPLPYPPNVFTYIIKIQTEWNVVTPKNIKLLIIPLPYPDEFEIMASSGILDPSISTQVNFQGYIFKTNKNIILKAGTPLQMVIPLTEKKYEMVQREATERDVRWIMKSAGAGNSTFWPIESWNVIKKMYQRYWLKG